MRYFLLMIGALLMLSGCKKKPAPPNNENSSATGNIAVKVYMSTDKNTIRLGQEAVITASVSGGEGNLSYQWEVSTIANLLGSGNTVTFSPCCSSVAGDNIVKCTVTDSRGNKGTGQITIVVNP